MSSAKVYATGGLLAIQRGEFGAKEFSAGTMRRRI